MYLLQELYIDNREKDDIICIGHRGAMGYEPENTLRSFAKAVELGADMVELDARITKDGYIVVIHDESVDNITHGKYSGYVRDMTLQELRKIEFEYGEKIPTLNEVIEFCIDKQVGVNIEVKDKNIEKNIYNIISSYNYLDKTLISSFDYNTLYKFKEIDSDLKLGLLFDENEELWYKKALSLGVYSINPIYTKIDKHMIDDAHFLGIKVIAWTVNKRENMEILKDYGVDGIITDFPDILRDVLGK